MTSEEFIALAQKGLLLINYLIGDLAPSDLDTKKKCALLESLLKFGSSTDEDVAVLAAYAVLTVPDDAPVPQNMDELSSNAALIFMGKFKEAAKELLERKVDAFGIESTMREEINTYVNLLKITDSQRPSYRILFDEVNRRSNSSVNLQLMAKTHAKIVDGSKPHVLGTVNELAEKYGVSKSEIRRHKAAGTLEQFVLSRESGEG